MLATTIQTLVVALVLNRLDYANTNKAQQYTLAGLPTYLFRRLQSVLNASARLIYGLGQHALTSLHWLRILERVKFKLAVIDTSGSS